MSKVKITFHRTYEIEEKDILQRLDEINGEIEHLDNDILEDSICKKCQFWEVDDCKDLKSYKKVILEIQNLYNSDLPECRVIDKIQLIIDTFLKSK